jgi:hypothetical protein
MPIRKHKIFPALGCSAASIGFAAFAIVFAATPQYLPFGAWRRASEAPILSPEGAGWESAGTFNPAVISTSLPMSVPTRSHADRRKIVMLYRAQDAAGTSRIGYAESTDGLHFMRWAHPDLLPRRTTRKMAASRIRGCRSSATRTT